MRYGDFHSLVEIRTCSVWIKFVASTQFPVDKHIHHNAKLVEKKKALNRHIFGDNHRRTIKDWMGHGNWVPLTFGGDPFSSGLRHTENGAPKETLHCCPCCSIGKENQQNSPCRAVKLTSFSGNSLTKKNEGTKWRWCWSESFWNEPSTDTSPFQGIR